MNLIQRTFILVALAVTTLTGCEQSRQEAGVAPLTVVQGTSCSLDGMLLADYPGPKAQIHYAGQTEPEFFCDTVEMFHMYLNPEQVRAVRGIFVQDMGQADWDNPIDQWIDAKTAYYVYGSTRYGSMGPTLASFKQEKDATRFSSEYGGKVFRFGEVTADMVELDGGVLHDRSM